MRAIPKIFAPHLTFILLLISMIPAADAVPLFAREYNMSCNTCHVAYPRLNAFGEQFAGDMNIRMPNWKESSVSFGDEQLALPDPFPVSVRAQAFTQSREARDIDVVSGETNAETDVDFQAPYLIKLISAAPLTEQISYYFYGIFAEKGENGTIIIEDAWFSYADIFETGVGLQLGQFQVSDLMFPREQRLNFQDYMAYRFAGITYERGVLVGTQAGPIGIDFGFVNGNGIDESYSINSPGYRRADHLFDNDDDKSFFARIGTEFGPVRLGVFALDGEQRSAAGPAGMDEGPLDAKKQIVGLDASGYIGTGIFWYSQLLHNEWRDFLAPGDTVNWNAAFVGLDYKPNERWVLSALYNHGDAGDLTGSDTIYEGIDMRTLTFTASYYFMRNVKGIIEVNVDLLEEEPQTGLYYTGHLDSENYILVGFDAAY